MKIVLIGYGRMGRAVEEQAEGRGHRIVGRVRCGEDPFPGTEAETGTRAAMGAGEDAERARPGRSFEDAEMAIDFSVGGAVRENVARAAHAGLDVVVGTTGWKQDEEAVRRTVEEAGIGFLHAPNFSFGAQLFYRLAALAGSLVGPLGSYDVHVWEAHHRHKRDHPSGTARRVANLLVETVRDKERWAEGPGDPDCPEALGVASVRVGEVAGIHVVGLDGPDDRIEIRHEARGRSGFARGAVEAAEWLAGRSGWYGLDDLLADRLGSAAAAWKKTRGAPDEADGAKRRAEPEAERRAEGESGSMGVER